MVLYILYSWATTWVIASASMAGLCYHGFVSYWLSEKQHKGSANRKRNRRSSCTVKYRLPLSIVKFFWLSEKLHKGSANRKRKITRRTIGAKGFNFLQERLDKKGLKGTTSLYLSITIYSLSSIIYCYYLSLSFNMCFKKLSF